MATNEERDILYATDLAHPQIEPEPIHPGATIRRGPGMRPPTERPPPPRPAPPPPAILSPWPVLAVDEEWRNYVAIRRDRADVPTIEARAAELEQAKVARLQSDATWLEQYIKDPSHLPSRAAKVLIELYRHRPSALRRQALDFSMREFARRPESDRDGRRFWGLAVFLAGNAHRPMGFALGVVLPVSVPAMAAISSVLSVYLPVYKDQASLELLIGKKVPRSGWHAIYDIAAAQHRDQGPNVRAAIKRAEEEAAADPYRREWYQALRRGDTQEAERLWQLRRQRAQKPPPQKPPPPRREPAPPARRGRTALTIERFKEED